MNKSSSSNLFLRLWNKVLEHWEVRASLLAPLQRHLTGRKKRKKKAACCWWNEILLVQPQRPHFIKCASSHCSHFSWAFWLPEWQQKAPQVAWPSVRFVLYTPPFFFCAAHRLRCPLDLIIWPATQAKSRRRHENIDMLFHCAAYLNLSRLLYLVSVIYLTKALR